VPKGSTRRRGVEPVMLGRTGAPCPALSWWVSPVGPPNRTCGSLRIRLSTGSCRWLLSSCCVVCLWGGNSLADRLWSEYIDAVGSGIAAREGVPPDCFPVQPRCRSRTNPRRAGSVCLR
jgi:hypothetical protein